MEGRTPVGDNYDTIIIIYSMQVDEYSVSTLGTLIQVRTECEQQHSQANMI